MGTNILTNTDSSFIISFEYSFELSGRKMIEPRQRPIPVTNTERTFLEEQKVKYEKQTGKSGDWGEFLAAIALLGLAAAGVYTLVKAVNRTPQSVDVNCSVCHKNFIMAVTQNVGQAVQTKCPYCQVDLVVNFSINQ